MDGNRQEADDGSTPLLLASDSHVEGAKHFDEANCTAFNWRGRPNFNNTTNGGTASFFILGNICLWYVAYFGIFFNIVLFFTKVLHRSNVSAAADTGNWSGSLLLFSFVGAFIADSYLGNLWTCAIFQAINLMGTGLVALYASQLSSGEPSSRLVTCFYLSLYTVALGCGSFLPTLQSLGGEQFDADEEKLVFFSRYVVVCNTGTAIANTVIVYVASDEGWAFGFWLCTGSGAIALVLFLLGLPTYRHYKPGGNPLSRMIQVLVAAARKWRVQAPLDGTMLYEASDKMSTTQRRCKLLHSRGLRYLDKAATMTSKDATQYSDGKAPNPWKLCTVTQVEELKCLCRVLPVWASGIMYNIIHVQAGTLFVEQGATMNPHFGSFSIQSPTMNMFSILSTICFPIIYFRLIAPCIQRSCKRSGPMEPTITPLQRIGGGYAVIFIGVSIAAMVETKRLSIARKEAISRSGPQSFVSMSILWLIPQFVLLGVGQFFVTVAQMEFFYAQTPPSMRSLGSSFCQTCIALGNFLNSFLLALVTQLTTRDGSPGWIPKDLNEGRLDYFYWLLASLTLLNLLVFAIYASRFEQMRIQTEVE